MTETVVTRLPRRVIAGVLSDLRFTTNEDATTVSATLTTTFQGQVTVRTIAVGDAVVSSVRDLLVEGPVVRFYAELHDNTAVVLGPDLTKRTLARQAAKAGAPSDAMTTGKAAGAKRPRTEAQDRAWRDRILPRLQAGRARKAAEQDAQRVGQQGSEVA